MNHKLKKFWIKLTIACTIEKKTLLLSNFYMSEKKQFRLVSFLFKMFVFLNLCFVGFFFKKKNVKWFFKKFYSCMKKTNMKSSNYNNLVHEFWIYLLKLQKFLMVFKHIVEQISVILLIRSFNKHLSFNYKVSKIYMVM